MSKEKTKAIKKKSVTPSEKGLDCSLYLHCSGNNRVVNILRVAVHPKLLVQL